MLICFVQASIPSFLFRLRNVVRIWITGIQIMDITLVHYYNCNLKRTKFNIWVKLIMNCYSAVQIILKVSTIMAPNYPKDMLPSSLFFAIVPLDWFFLLPRTLFCLPLYPKSIILHVMSYYWIKHAAKIERLILSNDSHCIAGS